MKKRIFALISTVLVISMLFTGCFSKSASTEDSKEPTSTEDSKESTSKETDSKEPVATEEDSKVATLVSGGEPGALHPGLAQGTHESIILDHIFEGLMKRDKEGNIVKGMASDYKISDDGLTYTFTIREDAKWSNGEKVVAEDFEYAWKYALLPETASEYAYQLYYLEGGEAVNSYDMDNGSEEELQALVDAVGVKAVDEKTLEVKLVNSTPYFLELCAFYTYYPVCKKVQEENPEWAVEGETLVSNGPFKIVEWAHDAKITTVKNNEYYNKEVVKLDGIDFIILEDQNTQWQMYENNEIQVDNDLPGEKLGQLRAEKNAELTTVADLATYYYNFNTTVKPFNNVKVRKALSMAIDRQLIIDEVAQGGQFPAYGMVPGGIPDVKGDFRENGGEYFSEEVDAAKKLLAEGLKEEGMDSLEFTILYNTSEGHKKIALAIQEMWKKLGVTVELENTEFKVKLDRESNGDFEVSRSGWIGDYVDPNTFLDMFTSWSSQNNTGWASDEYDKIIKDAGEEFDPEKRMKLLHDAEEMLMDEQPIMPIYYYTKSMMVKPNLVGTYKAINREISLVYADYK